jgi:hypothetical protein
VILRGGNLHVWERDGYDRDRSPDVQLRVMLTAAKRAGRPFFPAWVEALAQIDWRNSRRERDHWRRAFADPAVTSAWFAAYCDLPDPRGQACAELNWQALESAPVERDLHGGVRKLPQRNT